MYNFIRSNQLYGDEYNEPEVAGADGGVNNDGDDGVEEVIGKNNV